MYASRLPAANVTTSGVPILPSEPRSRIFDVLVKPLFKSVLVWPSTVTRQNVFKRQWSARRERHALCDGAVDGRADRDIFAAAAAEDSVGSG